MATQKNRALIHFNAFHSFPPFFGKFHVPLHTIGLLCDSSTANYKSDWNVLYCNVMFQTSLFVFRHRPIVSPTVTIFVEDKMQRERWSKPISFFLHSYTFTYPANIRLGVCATRTTTTTTVYKAE